MASKAVFVDRDNTLIEDPGYLTDPADVRLLPGVDLALRSLIQAEYKIVVVTNQSGVARGLLTEEQLGAIHKELQDQLKARNLRLDGIYYCPFHPEGTVQRYAKDSDLRKPNPGMLLEAAGDLDIDLSQSWMVGDSTRDVLAGKRAGCKTVRIRTHRPKQARAPEPDEDEDNAEAGADYTVRNFVDAARVVLRADAGVAVGTNVIDGPSRTFTSLLKERTKKSPQRPASRPASAPEEEYDAPEEPAPEMDDSDVLRQILQELTRLRRRLGEDKFSLTKMIAGIFQILAMLSLWLTLWYVWKSSPQLEVAQVWGLVTVALQTMSLTLFVMHRQR